MSNNNSYTTVKMLLSTEGINFFNSVPDSIQKLKEKLEQEPRLMLFLQRYALGFNLPDILDELESRAQQGSTKSVLIRLSNLREIFSKVCSGTGAPGRPEELGANLKKQLELIMNDIKATHEPPKKSTAPTI